MSWLTYAGNVFKTLSKATYKKANPIILRSQLVLWPKAVLVDPTITWFTSFGFSNFSPRSEFTFNGPESAMAEGYSKIGNYKSRVPKLLWPVAMLLKWGHSNFLLFEIIFTLGYGHIAHFLASLSLLNTQTLVPSFFSYLILIFSFL